VLEGQVEVAVDFLRRLPHLCRLADVNPLGAHHLVDQEGQFPAGVVAEAAGQDLGQQVLGPGAGEGEGGGFHPDLAGLQRQFALLRRVEGVRVEPGVDAEGLEGVGEAVVEQAIAVGLVDFLLEGHLGLPAHRLHQLHIEITLAADDEIEKGADDLGACGVAVGDVIDPFEAPLGRDVLVEHVAGGGGDGDELLDGEHKQPEIDAERHPEPRLLAGLNKQGQPVKRLVAIEQIALPAVEIEKCGELLVGDQRQQLGDIFRPHLLEEDEELLGRQPAHQLLGILRLNEQVIFMAPLGGAHHLQTLGKGEGVELFGCQAARFTQQGEVLHLLFAGQFYSGHQINSCRIGIFSPGGQCNPAAGLGQGGSTAVPCHGTLRCYNARIAYVELHPATGTVRKEAP
jgi:hypothetical protein